MNKKTLLIFTVILAICHANNANAQSLEFVYNEKALANNEKITITNFTSDPDAGVEMTFKATIKNKTANPVKLKVSKQETSIPAGSTNNFCTMLNCFTTAESNEYTLQAHGEDKDFHAVFEPKVTSTAIIQYSARVTNSLDDQTTVEVTYQYVAAGIEKVGFTHLAILQKNGHSEIVYNTNSDTGLKIFNLNGKNIATHTLPAANSNYVLSGTFYPGVYLFVFSNKRGDVFTQKVRINH